MTITDKQLAKLPGQKGKKKKMATTNSNSARRALKELARRELARRKYLEFAKYVYTDYKTNWHIEKLAEALELVEEGKIRNLIIEAPPRHSKSLNVAQLFPAWAVGRDPSRDVIVASYSGDLASSHGRETRNLLEDRRYQNIFSTTLAADSTARGKWNTNAGGSYNAVGVGGSATGKGADIFIIDDPIKDRKEADSKTIRDSLYDWFRSVARTRLSPTGAMIVMSTRWHEDDLQGRLLSQDSSVSFEDFKKGMPGKWVRLTFKAIAEEDEEHRKKGEPLWASRYSLKELEDIKRSLGPYEFSALYQAHPVDDASREFKADWFQYRDPGEVLSGHIRRFATIDPNFKKSDDSDYCGVVRNYVNSDNQWNIRAERYRVNSKEVLDLIFQLHAEGFEKIGIEDSAFTFVVEPFLRDEMIKRGQFPHLVPLKHGGTQKEVRIRGLIPWYANGQIYHLSDSCEKLEEELLSFPKGTHDDIADALAYQFQIAEAPQGLKAIVRQETRQRERVSSVADKYGLW